MPCPVSNGTSAMRKKSGTCFALERCKRATAKSCCRVALAVFVVAPTKKSHSSSSTIQILIHTHTRTHTRMLHRLPPVCPFFFLFNQHIRLLGVVHRSTLVTPPPVFPHYPGPKPISFTLRYATRKKLCRCVSPCDLSSTMFVYLMMLRPDPCIAKGMVEKKEALCNNVGRHRASSEASVAS